MKFQTTVIQLAGGGLRLAVKDNMDKPAA